MAMRMIRGFTVGTVAVGAATYCCTFVVRPGEGAVLYNKMSGLKDKVFTEGLNFRMIGLEEAKYFNIRVQPRELTTSTGTADLQVVNIRLRLLFHPDPEMLPTIYRSLGMDFDERLLPSISNEILKAVVAEYKAEDLIVQRDQVSEKLAQMLRKRAKEYHVIIDDVALVHIEFSNEFMTAVEQKQVAHQQAERFKYVVMKNEQEKLAAVVRAEGESTAAKLISDAIASHGEGLVALRKLEAAKEIASDLAASPNVHFLPSGASVLLNTVVNTVVKQR